METITMETESDPNVIYGGDSSEFGPLDGNCGSLGELIVSDLKKGGSRTAFINGTTNKFWTYEEILKQSTAAARALHGAGIKQNDVISIIAENCNEFIAISFGAIFLNAVVAPFNPSYTERELKHALELSKPKLIFVSPSVAKKTASACRRMKCVKNVVLIGGRKIDNFILSFHGFLKMYENSDFRLEDHVSKKVDIEDQVSLIFCSSGTTGLPKGVLTTQKNMMSCLQTYRGGLLTFVELTGASPVITLSIAPWFHVLGFISMFMYACSREAVYVFLSKFEETVFYKAIQNHKVNFLICVPPIMVLLAKSPKVNDYDLTSVKNISCGAAALSKEVEDQVKERFKGDVTIRQGYGMSETTYGVIGSIATIKPGSVGEVVRGIYAKVIDENGKSLGPNKPGELCFKGDRIMKGYINDPEATSSTIDKDGWLHSGDIAYYDEDKQFYIVDRVKELIKYKAFQVPPAEIEGLLLSHPKIKDCGVIGIPDEASGELPFAYVVKQPGAILTEQEIKDFVAANTSKAKWLRGGVKFINEIPKNPSGKLLRREMREMYKSSKAKL